MYTYANDILARYLDSGAHDTSIFEEEVMTLSDLLMRLEATSRKVLQELGYGSECKEIEARCRELRQVAVIVENIYMKALDGPEEVERTYRQRKFMYQMYSD